MSRVSFVRFLGQMNWISCGKPAYLPNRAPGGEDQTQVPQTLVYGAYYLDILLRRISVSLLQNVNTTSSHSLLLLHSSPLAALDSYFVRLRREQNNCLYIFQIDFGVRIIQCSLQTGLIFWFLPAVQDNRLLTDH